MKMIQPTPTTDLLNQSAKIFITEQYKCFIKPKHYKSENSRLKQTTVEYITEHFEPNDVDFSRVLAENEFYYLKESNPKVSKLHNEIKNLTKHRELVVDYGKIIHEAKLKEKLLKRLSSKGKEQEESYDAYNEKFEKVLAKNNSEFIRNFIQKIKGIEMSIGLEFPGSLNEAIKSSHQEMIEVLQHLKPGIAIECPKKRFHSAWILNEGFMLLFSEGQSEGFAEYKSEFYDLVCNKENDQLEMVALECDYKIQNKRRVQTVKYYSEASLLVVVSNAPMQEKFANINIYELRKSGKDVHLEPRHKIETRAEFVGFSRVNGVENILYSDDPLKENSTAVLKIVNLEETFTNPKNKPITRNFPIDMACYKYFNLGCNYVMIEGPMDHLALLDMEAGEVIAYSQETNKESYYNYLSATYSRIKNLLFVLHNKSSGAVVSTFSVDYSQRKLQLQQSYDINKYLTDASVQNFASQFFTMQFNTFQNRLDFIDDYQTCLLRFKLNDKRQLVKDKDPIKLNEIIKYDCTPSYFFTRIEGKLFFLHFYVFENVLTCYELDEA